jgi:predicted RNase H-like HicB family nuclease
LRARALGHPIYTQGEDIEELRNMVRDAVQLFFEEENTRPKIIRLHFVREEVIAA